MVAYFKLIRWPNLIVISLTMLVVRYAIIASFLKLHHLSFQLSNLNFIFLVLATVLVAAGGYVINDYFDRRIDMENKPTKVIVGTQIERRRVMGLHNILTAMGLMVGFYVSYAIDRSSFALIFIIISGALWFYSTLYKRQLLVGNILIALLTAAVPLLVLLYDGAELFRSNILVFQMYPAVYSDMQYMIYAVVLFAGFAFFTTLTREIIKDIEDMEGDSSCQRNTVPIAWGILTSKIIISILLIITILAIAFIYYIFLQGDMISLWYILLLLVAPIISLLVLLWIARSPKQFHFCSQFLKLIMIFGLLYAIPFYHFILQPLSI